MSIKLLTEHHLEFLSLKEAAEAHSSLHLSKCQIVGNLMPRPISDRTSDNISPLMKILNTVIPLAQSAFNVRQIRPASNTPFKWRFAGWPMVAR